MYSTALLPTHWVIVAQGSNKLALPDLTSSQGAGKDAFQLFTRQRQQQAVTRSGQYFQQAFFDATCYSELSTGIRRQHCNLPTYWTIIKH